MRVLFSLEKTSANIAFEKLVLTRNFPHLGSYAQRLKCSTTNPLFYSKSKFFFLINTVKQILKKYLLRRHYHACLYRTSNQMAYIFHNLLVSRTNRSMVNKSLSPMSVEPVKLKSLVIHTLH